MLIKSGIVTHLSGRSGSQVFAHNRSGQYARDFTSPIDPESARQLLLRGALGSANAEWRDLSQSDRSVWNNYGNSVKVLNRFGDPHNITGRAHFIAWFVAFTAATDAVPISFPVPTHLTLPSSPFLLDAQIAIDGLGEARWDGTMKQIDHSTDAGHDQICACYTSGPLDITRNFWKQDFPYHHGHEYVGGVSEIVQFAFDISLGWDIAGDEKCFFKARFIREDGRLSAFSYSNSITEPV